MPLVLAAEGLDGSRTHAASSEKGGVTKPSAIPDDKLEAVGSKCVCVYSTYACFPVVFASDTVCVQGFESISVSMCVRAHGDAGDVCPCVLYTVCLCNVLDMAAFKCVRVLISVWQCDCFPQRH